MVIAMRKLFLILLLLPGSALAESNNVILTWEPDQTWQTAAGGTYLPLEIAGVTAPRRLAVRILADRQTVAEVWDDPADRSVTVSVDTAGNRGPHIQAQAVAHEGGPWQEAHAYSLGDRVSAGDYPSDKHSWVVTTAGTSAATEPEWPAGKVLPYARATTLASGRCSRPWAVTQTACEATPDYCANSAYTTEAACETAGYTWVDYSWTPLAAVDNGNGTVTLPMVVTVWSTENATNFFAPKYYEGESITISGTTNYDGTYTLGDQSAAADGEVIITATYVAESFDQTEPVAIADTSAVDNGDGTVDLPLPAHGFVAGQDVTISGTANYNGTYTLGVQTDPDWLTLTATYAAEQFAGGTVRDLTVTDGTVGWTWTDQVARALTGSAASSVWGGTDLPCPGHNFERWRDVTISGTTNYDGNYTVYHVEPGVITIGATYMAETFGAGAQAASAAGLNVLTSEPSRRVVGSVRAEDGRIISGGMKFRVRQQ
jgi:hypothetical protein